MQQILLRTLSKLSLRGRTGDGFAPLACPMLRGIEDPADIIADLEQALA